MNITRYLRIEHNVKAIRNIGFEAELPVDQLYSNHMFRMFLQNVQEKCYSMNECMETILLHNYARLEC